MRKTIRYISIFAIFLTLGACEEYLTIEPLDKISPEAIFSTESGIMTALANVYSKMPMEDFNYRGGSYHQRPSVGGGGDGGAMSAGMTDEAVIHSNAQGSANPGSLLSEYWDYSNIRIINIFLETILDLKNKGTITEEKYNFYQAEARFVRAYIYFQMARRYGGVPIITNVQSIPANIAEIQVPRNTEKETWDFVLDELEFAYENLPPQTTTDGTFDGTYRATKWVAEALRSRVALHAASIAKYGYLASQIGDAVDQGLVGIPASEANSYYQICIDASANVIANSGKSLYEPLPATNELAAKNYQTMFESPSYQNPEIIYMRAYLDGVGYGGQQGHITDFWFYPTQVRFATGYHYSRFGATLDIVEQFEDYSANNVRDAVPIPTRVDGIENVYEGNPGGMTSITNNYIHYPSQIAPFANKDVRLRASIVLPGSTFKGTTINCQGGIIRTDGTPIFLKAGSQEVGGTTYFSYGTNDATAYSAFGNIGQQDANWSSTGFVLRKFLQETKNVTSIGPYGSTQGFIDLRLAEMYLNYAEAAVESNLGSTALASQYLNDIRRRANHRDIIQATIENIIAERTVEFIFEGQHYWDLIRRRTYHSMFQLKIRKSLVPVLDLRVNPPQYAFIRANNYYDNQVNGRTFDQVDYYRPIPGLNTNPNLVQNPGY